MKPQHLSTCNKTPVGTGEVIGAIHIPGSINRMSMPCKDHLAGKNPSSGMGFESAKSEVNDSYS